MSPLIVSIDKICCKVGGFIRWIDNHIWPTTTCNILLVRGVSIHRCLQLCQALIGSGNSYDIIHRMLLSLPVFKRFRVIGTPSISSSSSSSLFLICMPTIHHEIGYNYLEMLSPINRRRSAAIQPPRDRMRSRERVKRSQTLLGRLSTPFEISARCSARVIKGIIQRSFCFCSCSCSCFCAIFIC